MLTDKTRNAAGALRRIGRRCFNVLLISCILTGMTGCGTARKEKKEETTAFTIEDSLMEEGIQEVIHIMNKYSDEDAYKFTDEQAEEIAKLIVSLCGKKKDAEKLGKDASYAEELVKELVEKYDLQEQAKSMIEKSDLPVQAKDISPDAGSGIVKKLTDTLTQQLESELPQEKAEELSKQIIIEMLKQLQIAG